MKRTILCLEIPIAEETAAWINALNLEERSLQILSALPSDGNVWVAGHGERRSNARELEEAHINFVYKDFALALDDFRWAGQKLAFPRGLRLIHVTPGLDEGTFFFETVMAW
jgi:hypothetical protein